MCGIAGVRRFNERPILATTIQSLMVSLQHRGLQATGVALAKGKEVLVLKSDVSAWEFSKSKDLEDFLAEHLSKDTETVLIHDRAATKGDPQRNENNHPIFSGLTAVTHNGVIHNDDQLFREMKLERKAEVDSDIFRAILDAEGLTQKGLNSLRRINGSAAIAAVSPNYPGKLLLARSGSPMVLCYNDGHVMWASEKQALHRVTRPYFVKHGITFQMNRAPGACGFITMNDHSAWLLGEKGLEWHMEFNPCASYQPRKYAEFEKFRSSRKRFNYPDADGKVDCVVCPNRECGRINHLPEEYAKTDLKELECRVCGANLEGSKLAE